MGKNKKLNNKGYMLIEIILASALAFGLAYFLLELTLKLKNRNDDLMIATLMATDKTIISNKVMARLKEKNYVNGCNEVNGSEIIVKDYNSDNKVVTILFENNNYNYEVNEYATIGEISGDCNYVYDNDTNAYINTLHIKIPLRDKVNKDSDEFDIDLYYLVHDN